MKTITSGYLVFNFDYCLYTLSLQRDVHGPHLTTSGSIDHSISNDLSTSNDQLKQVLTTSLASIDLILQFLIEKQLQAILFTNRIKEF